jgi:NTE family protein
VETQRTARRVALVLTGGGARGAFQFGAEQYAREVKGYRWDVIAGVSVGALNSTVLSMGKYKELEELWTGDLTGKIYTGDLQWWSILSFGLKHLPAFVGIRSIPFLNFDARSLLGNEPLRRLIDQHFERDKVRCDLRIGVVSLQTGRYYVYRLADGRFQQKGEAAAGDSEEYVPIQLDDRQFKQLVLASTAIPVIWPPEDLRRLPYLRAAVDGGVRNINPIGDVLDALESPDDEVVIVSCTPREVGDVEKTPTTGVDIAKRSLDVALAEIARTDIHEFERINRLVEQAAREGFTLKNKRGEPYRYFKWHVIEPDEPLDDTLDFSTEALKRSIARGREKARAVLG